MPVAIIGSQDDAHPQIVRSHIQERGIECEIFDPNRPNFTFSISFDSNRIPKIEFRTDGGEYFAPSVYWWRTKPINFRFSDADKQDAADFSQREWAHSLRAALILSTAKSLNNPEKQFLANHKPVQLAIAQSLGFNIPKTEITNDCLRIPEVNTKTIVYKPMTWLSRYPHEMLFANLVDKSLLIERDISIKSAPCIFQEYIGKSYEARISVFGEQIFGTKINSQAAKKSTIDWRRDILADIYEPMDVPQKISDLIAQFQNHFGLDMGMYDFIIGEDNEWYFLECNPAGQWIWLEEATMAPMTSAFVDLLIRNSS